MKRGRLPRRDDWVPRHRDRSTTQKIKDMDARIDAINTDKVMCKAFSATLKGPARVWFKKLSPRTIDSFGDLSRFFISNFMSYRVRQKNASHLFTIHQKDGESLKDYVKHFNQAVLEVEDASDKVVVMAMMEGLRLEGEEELDSKRAEYRDELKNWSDRDVRRKTNDRCPRALPYLPNLVLSPLNAPIAQVLIEIKHEEFIKCLRKIKTNPHKRNRNKKYVDDHPHPVSPERRRYSDNRPMARDIQVIHGGFELGGCSSSSKKRHVKEASGRAEEEVYNLSSPLAVAHQPITFTNDDLRGLHLPHEMHRSF
ncbi:hypothetical protein Acr_16g0000830 [Actinidia rufa]|uniref:Retrotransposon gag domain-containing protein n=1 Tax=Actinidia rufa TaxID=165716 RepID=A0A7J0FXP1_9ERIC|nr:hypothetical protein Acr_16g0000830 [Actinidia rufa]